MDEFVVSTEDLNDHGYRVLTKGIQLDRFLKNPVMYFEHEGGKVPIGKWVNLRKDGSKLIATPEFNEKDEFALKIKQAVEDGFVNATSIGATPLKWSDAPEDLVKGQYRCTVVEASLYEISFVGLPSNPNTVRLSANNQDFEVPKLKQKKDLNMKQIALSLGLKESATEAEMVAAINASKENQNTQNIDALIALGRANGHINDDNVEVYRNSAKNDYAVTLKMVEKTKEKPAPLEGQEKKEAPEPVTLAAVLEAAQKINAIEHPKAYTKAEQFIKLSKNDPDELARIAANEPKLFNEMQASYVASLKKK